jgi:hypothetical protein
MLSLGIGAVIVGLILPAYKSQQTFTASGPKITFTSERTYWIDYYLIPPIDEGTPILLSLFASKPASTWVFLAPFDLQTESISGPSVVNEMLGSNNTGLVVFGRAPKTSMYSLRISSWNSTYSVRVESRWSRFFQFRYGIVVGAGLIPASLFLFYYDGVVEKRDRMWQEALGNAKVRRDSMSFRTQLNHLRCCLLISRSSRISSQCS